jgi:cobalt-zinc-cadmium efflux system membrane fusion protein
VFLAAAIVFLALGIVTGRALHSCNDPAGAVCADHSNRDDGHGHGGHRHGTAGAERAEGGHGGPEQTTCEHGLRTIDCDNCRFEAGLVKIDPSVAESLIETGAVEEIERKKVLRLTGQVQLDRTRAVDVVCTGGGLVKRVMKLLGQKVEQAEGLAVIHSADLGQAKADFLEVQAKLELARATFNREKELYEKNISSQADYLSALNELKAAEASYAASDKRLHLFGLGAEQMANIKNEKENGKFADLVVRAPQAGTIIAQNISAGNMVEASENLYKIADLANLWVWCDVYEKDLAILHEHFSKGERLKAVVRVKAFESSEFEGVVDLVGNLMDEHTRTIKVRVQVKNPQSKLRPGMFADVEVIIPLQGSVAAVPHAAVMSDAGKHFVFRRLGEDLWARTDVAVGSRQGDYTEILGGISKGATVVTGGTFMLKSDVLREKMGAGCAD